MHDLWAVLEESLYLRATDTSLPPERIDLSRLLASGMLNICSAETPDEEALYVELASQLDDGKALSMALIGGGKFCLRALRCLSVRAGSAALS